MGKELMIQAVDNCLGSIERIALTFYRLGFRTPAQPLIDGVLVWPSTSNDQRYQWLQVGLKQPGQEFATRYRFNENRERIRDALLASLHWDPIEVGRFLEAAGKVVGECWQRLRRPKEILEREPVVREALEARLVMAALGDRPEPNALDYPLLVYRVLEQALNETWRAVDDLLKGFPGPEQAWIEPAPRIELAPGLFWPAVAHERPEVRPTLRGIATAREVHGWDGSDFDFALTLLITATYDDPRLVLKAVEGLEAIAAWCRNRLEYPDRVLAERPDIRELLEYWAKKGGEK